MVSSLLLEIGYKSLNCLANSSSRRTAVKHPLAAYPRLHMLVSEAERSGTMAAERRKLMVRRLSV